MTARTPAQRAARCTRIAAAAGWVAIVGAFMLAAGIAAGRGVIPPQFVMLSPVGLLTATIAGVVCVGGGHLADRHSKAEENGR